jgi:hypothetical protein
MLCDRCDRNIAAVAMPNDDMHRVGKSVNLALEHYSEFQSSACSRRC